MDMGDTNSTHAGDEKCTESFGRKKRKLRKLEIDTTAVLKWV
jgi:hypothetical protein